MIRLLVAAIVGLAACCPALAQVGALPPGQARPVLIATSLRVLDISRVQENLGEMSANVEFTLKWSDSRLAFDAQREGRTQKQFSERAAAQELDKMWHPAAALRNIIGSPRSDEAGLIIGAGGEVTLVRLVDASFRFPIDMTEFPFDDLILPIELTSSRFAQTEVVFTHFARDDAVTTLNPNPRASSWRLQSLYFDQKEYVGWNGENRSLLVVNIEAKRKSGQVVLRIFVPFFMIMMSSLFVLWLPDTNYFGKGTMIFSAVIALVALTFTLESNFPGSMSLQTPVSLVMTTGFIYLVSALILNILVMNPEAVWAKKHSYLAAEVRSIIKWAVPVLMLVIWLSLILRAMV